MKRDHFLQAMVPDMEIMLEKSPITARLRALARELDFTLTVKGDPRPRLRAALRVTASTDPWSEIQYQSLYLTAEGEDRLVLQEPATEDPTVGIMVLKAARLRGESGMVYCGTPEQLQSFAEKLPEYETRGEELSEKDFLECLNEAAVAEGLQVIFERLSPEHGGEEMEEDWN